MFLISKCRGDWNLGLCPASVLAFAEPLRSSKIRFFLRRNMFFPRISAKIYLPGKGEPQINKCGPWKGAGHCTLVLWTSTTSSSMRARQLHPFSGFSGFCFRAGPFSFLNKTLANLYSFAPLRWCSLRFSNQWTLLCLICTIISNKTGDLD